MNNDIDIKTKEEVIDIPLVVNSNFEVNQNALTMIKGVCPESATLGTILTFNVILTNNSSEPLNNTVFSDILDSNLTLVPNSIYVNEVLQPEGKTLNNLYIPSLQVTTPRTFNTVRFS